MLCLKSREAMTGFEPVNGGFADHCLRPLGYIAEMKWKLSAPSPAVKKYLMHSLKISDVLFKVLLFAT